MEFYWNVELKDDFFGRKYLEENLNKKKSKVFLSLNVLLQLLAGDFFPWFLRSRILFQSEFLCAFRSLIFQCVEWKSKELHQSRTKWDLLGTNPRFVNPLFYFHLLLVSSKGSGYWDKSREKMSQMGKIEEFSLIPHWPVPREGRELEIGYSFPFHV